MLSLSGISGLFDLCVSLMSMAREERGHTARRSHLFSLAGDVDWPPGGSAEASWVGARCWCPYCVMNKVSWRLRKPGNTAGASGPGYKIGESPHMEADREPKYETLNWCETAMLSIKDKKKNNKKTLIFHLHHVLTLTIKLMHGLSGLHVICTCLW